MTPKASSIQTYLFRLLIFLLPTQLGLHFWPDFAFVFGIRVDYFSPTIYLTDILTLLLVSLWFFRARVRLLETIKNFWKIILFLLIFSVANIFVSQNPQVSVLKWIKVYELIIFAFVISHSKLHWVKDVFIPLSLSMIVFGAIGLFQFVKQGSIGGLFYFLGERTFTLSSPGVSLADIGGRQHLRIYSTFSHPNSLAGFALVSFLLLFRARLNRGKFYSLKLWSQAVSLTSVIFTFSLAVYLTTIFVVFFSSIKNYRLVFLVFIFCLFASMLLPIFADNIKALAYLSEGVSERLSLSVAAGELFSKSPVMGVGLNNFIYRLPETGIPKTTIWHLQPVHNIFLLVLVETGLLGFLAFCCFIYRIFSDSSKIPNPKLITAILAILLTGLVDHYWLTLQQNQLLFALVVGLTFNKQLAHRIE